MYTLDVKFRVTDTDFGKGDVDIPVPGSLLVEYPRGEDGRATDGKTKVLYFSMYENFTIESVVDVTTTMHHFAPECNGETKPTWRKPGDAGFPKRCEYRGNIRAIAVGTLQRDTETIEWDKCRASGEYWSSDRHAYTEADKSRGRGCLQELHAVGNVRCKGRLGCKIGKLSPGDNPVFLKSTQPLIPGPPGTPGRLFVSKDLTTIRSPEPTKGGHGSYNLPNHSPSRVWFSFTGTRNDASRLTTCR
jgi:hypothetical protein